MKDEEMAEEYICNGKCQDDITRNYVHCKTCTRIKDFLAGLKAGRPQWHKVADGDLPKDMENVIINAFDYGINTCYVAHRLNGKWKSNCSSETFIRVIAWCEIPTFDKE